MARYLIFGFNSPIAGREEEYHAWYASEHFPDNMSQPGMVSGKRGRLIRGALSGPREPDQEYVSVYELEVDDLQAWLDAGAHRPPPRSDPREFVAPDTRVGIYELIAEETKSPDSESG